MINLLPQQHQRALHTDYIIRLAFLVFFFVFVIALISLILLAPSYFLATGKLASAQMHADVSQKLLALRKETPASSELARLAERTRLLDAAAHAPQFYATMSDILAARGKVLVNGIFLDGPSSSDTGIAVRVSGVAPTRDALLGFLSQVRHLSTVHDADVPVSDLVSGSSIPFTLTVNMLPTPQTP